MKKITTGILATLACLACLSGCSGKGNDKDPTGIEASVALEGAKAFLEAKYKKQVSEVSANYELPNTVAYDGVTYELSWSVDVDKDVIVERDDEEGITYINVNESAAEDVKYVLTGTIKDADGNELKVEFKCKLLQGPTTAAVRIIEAPVVGTAYKLYVYQGATGEHCYVNGKMKNTYYFETVNAPEDGIDVYVEAVEGKEGKFYLYHNVVEGEGEEATTTKTYINVVKSGTHTNAKYQTTATTEWEFNSDYKTMTTELEGKTFYLGCDGTYNTVEPQSSKGEGYYTAYLSGILEKTKITDDIKLETAFNTLTMAAAYVDEFDTTLPTQDTTFTDVKIAWECDSDKVTLGKNINDTQKTTFKAGSATDTIVLKAVMTCGEEKATKEFNVKLVPNDGEAIAAAALELKAGESFGNEATLTGMVTKLNRTGLAEYGNIEATMAANGDITTLINCYQLVGITDYQAKDVDYGYNVTVKGILTNYNGTIQFGKGCEIVSFTAGSRNDIPGIKTTPADIVDAAYALEDGKSMYVDYTLTGVITKVDTAYSADNKNISVTIAVEGKEDKPIMCYRMKGEGVNVIKVGDTITVTGTLKNHKGTIEFDTGCRLDSYVVGEGGGEVDPPAGGEVTAPDADAELTIAQAVAYGKTLTDYTTDKYYVSGKITGFYGSGGKTYGNVYIEDENGDSILVYGLYSADGSVRYDKMENKPVEGDTIKVYGVLGQYNGTPQFKDAWLIEHTPGSGEGGSGEVTPPAGGDETKTDPLASKVVTSPAANVAYNFYMYQGKADKVVYISGGMAQTYYLATSADASAALSIYLEETTGGYYMYCYVNEVKTYINMVESGTHVNGVYDTTASTVYTFNTEYNTLVNANGYYFGTRSDKDYTTMGPCAPDTIATNFVAHFIEDETSGEGGSGEVTPPAGGEGGDEGDPDVPENAKTATLSIADYATANGWANQTLYPEVVMDGFTITSSGTAVGSYGLNTGKYYTSGNTWRMYQAEKASVVIMANEGITIVSVKVSYVSEKTGTLTLNGTNIASDEVVTVNNTSITFGVGNTSSSVSNGQARIQGFEIVYVEAPKAPTYALTLRDGNPMMGGYSESFEYEEGAALELPALTAEGKTFKGWFALDGESNPTVAAPATMPAEVLVLFAVWEIDTYTLTIKQDGVEDKTFTFAVEYDFANGVEISVADLSYVLADNLPEGYKWEENVPETFELKDYTFTAISAEVPKYTLTLRNGNPMMGGTTEILEYVEGAALELPALTADGKNFLGWYSMDDNGDLVVAAPATMPAESIALFAKWEVIPYTLTIVQDGQEDKTFTFGVEYADGIDISVNDLAYVLEENLPAEAVWVETIPSTFELKDYTFTAKVIETLSIEEALALGKTFAHNAYSTEKYYISGIITSITNTTYGNCYINDVSGNSILVYGINDANGARYDAMTTKPVVGDTVKLLSVVGCYSGAAQLKSATLVEISATEDADKVAIEKAALEFSESVNGGMTIDLATAGKSFSNVAIAWDVTAGNDIASIADNALLLMNPDVDTTITLAATISCGEASATKEFTVAVAHKDESSTAPAELAVFEFGANGSAHVDGNDIGTSKTYTENGYTLALTNVSKVYDGAYDAKGNSCIKFGTSSKTGSMTFTVPADVTSVVIKVAKYKTNTTKINVNGTAYTLTKNSNDGAYDEIVVDTSSTKTVSFATVSGGVRCMVNSITFIG